MGWGIEKNAKFENRQILTISPSVHSLRACVYNNLQKYQMTSL